MPAFSLLTYRRIVQASALYDILATAPLATPWTFDWDWRQLSALNQWLGGRALAPFGDLPTLVACLLGSLVLVWSAVRIAGPEVRLGRADGIARFLFSTWMAWALVRTDAPLLWAFLVAELAWGVVQWWPIASREADQDGERASSAFTNPSNARLSGVAMPRRSPSRTTKPLR